MQERSEVDNKLSDDPRLKVVDRVMKRLQFKQDALIEVLHTAQDVFGYLRRDLLAHIAKQMELPESQVFGVASFYHFFSLRPKGEHSCIVCTGTACYVKGAGELLAGIEKSTGIRAGQTTADGRLSLGAARCLGNCSLAPMMTIDDKVYGPETAETALARLQNLLEVQDAQG